VITPSSRQRTVSAPAPPASDRAGRRRWRVVRLPRPPWPAARLLAVAAQLFHQPSNHRVTRRLPPGLAKVAGSLQIDLMDQVERHRVGQSKRRHRPRPRWRASGWSCSRRPPLPSDARPSCSTPTRRPAADHISWVRLKRPPGRSPWKRSGPLSAAKPKSKRSYQGSRASPAREVNFHDHEPHGHFRNRRSNHGKTGTHRLPEHCLPAVFARRFQENSQMKRLLLIGFAAFVFAALPTLSASAMPSATPNALIDQR
jgi:hypothetical protein